MVKRVEEELSRVAMLAEDELAAALREPQRGWPAERVAFTIDRGDRRVVRLAAAVPIHLTYFPAGVESEVVHFRPDIYNHDVGAYASAY